MNKTAILLLALVALTFAKRVTHEQTTALACCPTGMVFDTRLLTCVCPPGTEPTGPAKVCCKPGQIYDPIQKQCGCASPKHLNPINKDCESCPTNHIWDETKNQCVCPS